MQAQLLYGETETIRYTTTPAVTRNTVVVIGTSPGTGFAAVAMADIAATEEGAVTVSGVFEVVKEDAADFSVGETVYWSATGDPMGGDAETGALTDNAENYPMGIAVEAAGTETSTVKVKLQQPMVASA